MGEIHAREGALECQILAPSGPRLSSHRMAGVSLQADIICAALGALPDYQNPDGKQAEAQEATGTLALGDAPEKADKPAWPKTPPCQTRSRASERPCRGWERHPRSRSPGTSNGAIPRPSNRS